MKDLALGLVITLGMIMAFHIQDANAQDGAPLSWRTEWSETDFSRTDVDFAGIMRGCPQRDCIPSIDNPRFEPASDIKNIPGNEPVISLSVDGEQRAYPIRLLTWHEIVNDEIGGIPVAVTFCPLCNAAVIYDRRVGEHVLEFGVSGMLRNSDMVMYDRETMSWWQQFNGRAIVGEMTGARLRPMISRFESLNDFKARAPEGDVLVPNNPDMRNYGINPYTGYDTSRRPFLFDGSVPEGISALERVVSLESRDRGWSLAYIRINSPVETGSGVTLSWQAGRNSALDAASIAESRDVGTVTAVDEMGNPALYYVDFAFAFHAFYPAAEIHHIVSE